MMKEEEKQPNRRNAPALGFMPTNKLPVHGAGFSAR